MSDTEVHEKRRARLRLLALGALVVAISIVHQTIEPKGEAFHHTYQLVPYAPILLGAFWYGLRGALVCSVLTSICFGAHMFLHGVGGVLGENLADTLNIVLFNVVGLATGYLSQRRMSVTARYRQVARDLDRSYAELKERTDALQEAQSSLRRAAQLSTLGELSAGIAHEIRNPLGSIRATAQILADASTPEDKRREFSEILVKEVDRLNEVVHRFLDFARSRELELQAVDLNDLVTAVLDLCSHEIGSAGIDVHTTLGDRARVKADPDQLRQALLNIIINAVQAMPAGGVLSASTRADGDVVRCDIRDTGSGIAEEHLDHLFDPFFTTKPDGTGLGLAIAHRIANAAGGEIEVSSRPNAGSTFTLVLPSGDALSHDHGDDSCR